MLYELAFTEMRSVTDHYWKFSGGVLVCSWMGDPRIGAGPLKVVGAHQGYHQLQHEEKMLCSNMLSILSYAGITHVFSGCSKPFLLFWVSCYIKNKLSMSLSYSFKTHNQCGRLECFFWKKNQPAHEIMVLFVLHKLILQTHMSSHPVGLHVWILVGPFIYFHTSCVRTAKALARLRRCAGSPEPLLDAYVISTIISCAGWNAESLLLYIFQYKIYKQIQS